MSFVEFLENKNLSEINLQFEKFRGTNNTELEFRLGEIKGNFNPNLSDYLYKSIIKLMHNLEWEKKLYNFVDVYSDNLRTRYIFADSFNQYVAQTTIIKEKISTVDIKLKNLYGIDIRSALSNEIFTSKKVLTGTSFKKDRVSFIQPQGFFVIDITSIQGGEFKDKLFESKGNKKYQIEMEILNKNMNIENTFNFLMFLLKNIM